MIRAYAYLSKKRPYIHLFNVILTISIFAFSCYQLLINEAVIFSAGFIFVGGMVTLFSKSSSYKQKYLGRE